MAKPKGRRMGKATSGTKRGRNRAGESFENERRKVSDGGRRKRYRNYLDISFGTYDKSETRFRNGKSPDKGFSGMSRPAGRRRYRSFVRRGFGVVKTRPPGPITAVGRQRPPTGRATKARA